MKITAKSYYDTEACKNFIQFELSEFNSKITKFLKSLGLEKVDKFTYRVDQFLTMPDPVYGAVRVADVVYFQLKKVIVYGDNRTTFHNYTKKLDHFSIKDGVLRLSYSDPTGNLLVATNRWVGQDDVRSYLFDLGFSYDSVNKQYHTLVTYQLLQELKSKSFTRILGYDDHALATEAYRINLANENRVKLLKAYPTALMRFQQNYTGDYKPLAHQAHFLTSVVHWGNILGFDMGTGKTWTSLYQACVLKTIMPLEVVVVCPKSVKQDWLTCAYEHFPISVQVFTWQSMPQPPQCNYIVIFDECHYMQDAKSTRAYDARKLAAKASWVLNLSGTISRNGKASELFNILRTIEFSGAMYKKEYEAKYGWDAESDMKQLKLDLERVYFNVHKDEVLDLPSKRRVRKQAEIDAEYTELYDEKFSAFMKLYHERVEKGEVTFNPRMEMLVALAGLRQALALAKSGSTFELTQRIVATGEQVVIFSDFKDPLEHIQSLLDKAGISYTRMYAEDSEETRANKQLAFRQGRFRVFLSTFKLGGAGVNLTPCTNAIFNDRPYTPGDAMQAEERIHRIGQLKPATVWWMWWSDPSDIELKIAEIISTKQNNINNLNNYQVYIDFEEEL
jgi:superfamily II DNA or RNA helicase